MELPKFKCKPIRIKLDNYNWGGNIENNTMLIWLDFSTRELPNLKICKINRNRDPVNSKYHRNNLTTNLIKAKTKIKGIIILEILMRQGQI